MQIDTKSGYIAIIGRPNVGKSTLLNSILGQKMSITSKKPQTTRHKILGVKTINEVQAMYVDTPGIHSQAKYAINHYMNTAALSTLNEVDIIVFVIEALKWTLEDEKILQLAAKTKMPMLLAINKVDIVADKEKLLPFIEKIKQLYDFTAIVPISATAATNVNSLESKIHEFLAPDHHYFPQGQITDRDLKFRVAEIIREKLMRNLGQELPYQLTVIIDNIIEQPQQKAKINATIFVEREGHKNIVIGKGGDKLKTVGTKAREDIEKIMERKVYLNLWVKVKTGWSNNATVLKQLGYN